MEFKGGDQVEIKKNEEGFPIGCYYPATILKSLGNEYLVQYKNLLEDDKKHLVKEVVDAREIRPLSPRIQVMDYRVGDLVDVCDDEGWRVGKFVERRNCNDIGVCFGRGDGIYYPSSKVRIHQEWRDDEWFLSRTSLPPS